VKKSLLVRFKRLWIGLAIGGLAVGGCFTASAATGADFSLRTIGEALGTVSEPTEPEVVKVVEGPVGVTPIPNGDQVPYLISDEELGEAMGGTYNRQNKKVYFDHEIYEIREVIDIIDGEPVKVKVVHYRDKHGDCYSWPAHWTHGTEQPKEDPAPEPEPDPEPVEPDPDPEPVEPEPEPEPDPEEGDE